MQNAVPAEIKFIGDQVRHHSDQGKARRTGPQSLNLVLTITSFTQTVVDDRFQNLNHMIFTKLELHFV